MGACCSTPQDQQLGSVPRRRRVTGGTAVEDNFNQADTAIKILDNKIGAVYDKLNEFMVQSIQQSIHEAKDAKKCPETTLRDKLSVLLKFESQCQELLNQIGEHRDVKNQIKQKLDNHKNGNTDETLIKPDEMDAITKQIKQKNEDVKSTENQYKQQYGLFLDFKDNADTIDSYESALLAMISEAPQVQNSLNKLQNTIQDYQNLLNNDIDNNPNYEPEFRHSELKYFENIRKELVELEEQVDQLNTIVATRQENRELVNQKKFTEPEFVSKEWSKLMEASSKRERCKRQHDKIKHALKDKREQYSELHLDSILQNLEARIAQLTRDISELEAMAAKKNTEDSYQKHQARILQLIEAHEQVQQQMQQKHDLKQCPINELSPFVDQQKSICEGLLSLEEEVAKIETEVFSKKVQKTFGRSEEKLVKLNQAKYKLSPDELRVFDYISKTQIEMKNRYASIMDSVYNLKSSNTPNGNYDFKNQVEQIQRNTRELKNLYMESKMILAKTGEMRNIEMPTFSDPVDEMLYLFKDRNDIKIIIKKLSVNNYQFGTKKIFAKVNNGILLVRVGGGFMDIDSFYRTYGQQEIVKQKRAGMDIYDESDKQTLEGLSPNVKKIIKKKAAKIKKGVKTQQPDDLNQDDDDGLEPGHYEISLGDGDEDTVEFDLSSPQSTDEQPRQSTSPNVTHNSSNSNSKTISQSSQPKTLKNKNNIKGHK